MTGRNTVQEIKEKLSIVDVVQPYVKLKRSGRNWSGLSPFNKEKTSSFFVSPERGSYYCFSSSQGGDMFTFIEKMEGVDFKGALKILAEKAGVEIHYENNNNVDNTRIDRSREAIARAEEFFVSNLTKDGDAYKYAVSRGLTDKTISEWRIGFAPDGWRTLLEHLGAKGFSVDELLSAGLIKEADGKRGTYYDRFRNRLMFPIRDNAGRTIAFTGRALSSEDKAKYLNSPETDIFKKSENIFGISRAKDAIRTRGFALLVEGQIDVLHCHQTGFTNTIALSGTALSQRHISLIKRYADNLLLVLDSDRAGLSATFRSAIMALEEEMHVKVGMLPDGQDPADLISTDSKLFSVRMSEAKPVVEFFLSVLAAKESDTHRLVRSVEKTVLPLISAIKSPLEKEHFVGIVARAIVSTPDAVRNSLLRVDSREKTAPAVKQEEKKNVVKNSVVVSQTESLSAIAANYPDSELAKRIQNEYARIVGTPLPEPSERAMFEVGIEYDELPEANAANDLINALEKSILEKQYTEALANLRNAQISGNKEKELEAESKCDALLKKLSACL